MVLRYVPTTESPATGWPHSRSVFPYVPKEIRDEKARGRFVPHTDQSTRALRVLQVMPPGKHFGPLRATSIDLDTHDLVRFSQYRDTTVVMADQVSVRYPDISMACYERHASVEESVTRTARQVDADVIVVQQRLPLASQIARAIPDVPVILRRHNLCKSFEDRFVLERRIRRSYSERLYSRLSGIMHVSQASNDDFERKWPEVRLPATVIANGLDLSEWSPARERTPEVLLVARCIPEKGVLEAVQAMAKVLPQFSGWRGRVILSSVDEKPAYAARVFEILDKNRDVITVETNRPFSEVRSTNERAAIALVPSKWVEPFGRTALEAHAGGAALISSGRGGLSEISAETAAMLPEVSSQAIAQALQSLISDDAKRARLASAGAARARQLFDIRIQAAAMDQFLAQAVKSRVSY